MEVYEQEEELNRPSCLTDVMVGGDGAEVVANTNVAFYRYLLALPRITFALGARNTIRIAAALWAVLGFGTPWHRRPRCR